MMEEFYIEKKIYYHDTDSGGVVYYGNYLNFLEEARTEFCLARGINTKELSEQGIYFVVAHIDVDYKSPARYLDKIKVLTSVEKTGRVSVHFRQTIKKDDQVLVEAGVIWVCVTKDFKPRSVPGTVRRLL